MVIGRLLRLVATFTIVGSALAAPSNPEPWLAVRGKEADYRHEVTKWEEAKYHATDIVELLSSIHNGTYAYTDDELSKPDLALLQTRYFGHGSEQAVKVWIMPMFTTMFKALQNYPNGRLKYSIDRDHPVAGSAFTLGDVIHLQNQKLVKDPYVESKERRARVWIHEMAHLPWVKTDPRINDVSTHSRYWQIPVKSDMWDLVNTVDAVYGDGLCQYLAWCYPDLAVFNNDNIARFAMAVFKTKQNGKVDKEMGGDHHKCVKDIGKYGVWTLNVPKEASVGAA